MNSDDRDSERMNQINDLLNQMEDNPDFKCACGAPLEPALIRINGKWELLFGCPKCDAELNNMTSEELDAELRKNGIDPQELNKKILDRLLKARDVERFDTPMLHEAIRQFQEAVNEQQS